MAQYGDGAANDIYSIRVNPIFVGMPFIEVASVGHFRSFKLIFQYLYDNFQVILIAVKGYINHLQKYHLMLNPGRDYILCQLDDCIFIGQDPSIIKEINNLVCLSVRCWS